MENLIFLYYFLGLFPGLVAGGLAWSVFLGHQSPLSRRYIRLFGLMIVYFSQMVLVYYMTEVIHIPLPQVESWSQPLYLLIYAFFSPLAAAFFLELVQVPQKGLLLTIPRVLAGAGILLLLGLFLIYGELSPRIDAFRFWVQFVYVPIFLVFLGFLVVFQFMKISGITDAWKRGTVKGSIILILVFLPLFGVDALWPLFQMKLGLIPKGFNFFGFFFLAFSVFYLLRWRKLLSSQSEEPLLETEARPQPDPERLRALILTQREEEVLLEIFAGLNNQQISDRLRISLGTVKNHIYHIFQKTGASSRRELVKMLS